MARGRMLDRSFVKSHKLNTLTRDQRLVYASILPFLDREGRTVAEPIVLKALVFRWSDFTLDEIAEAVAALARVGLVHLYADQDNAAIIQYTQFSEFNSPNAKEAKSELPGPEDPGASECRDEAILGASNGPHEQGTGIARAMPVENGTERNVQRERTTEGEARASAREPSSGDLIYDSPEARFERLAKTGFGERDETARVRAALTRTAGAAFARQHADMLTSWARWTDDQIDELWEASRPGLWRGEEHKQREWLFSDLLRERRTPHGKQPERLKNPYLDYAGARGTLPGGQEFEVIGATTDFQRLITDVGKYLTPAEVDQYARTA